ncbi:MAG TPA: YdeI/OmpD-associated family protein [Prolixibacteraceae bacterium]|nr:YdeI/OmpD-associated family protein [Prolixibacteraceae bacterium]
MGKVPVYFTSSAEFRKWLEENYQVESELIVSYYKVSTKKPSMSWSDSVDEAICFGWIDGIRRTVDDESYSIRFTPRSPKSNWSAVNIKKVEKLINQGKMKSAGLTAFEKKTESRSTKYSYENRHERRDSMRETKFQENTKAWNFFLSQAPSYQKTMIYWVMSAKHESTQNSRLGKLIEASEAGKHLV